jgi:zinc transporter ZupT
MELWIKIITLFVSVVIGAILVDLFKKSSNLKLLLSFSGGFLLTIIFTHIFPELYSHLGYYAGYLILLGFLFQLALEYFSEGAEHGHAHTHKHGTKVFPLAVFISLSIHAFMEAVPLEHHGHSHIHVTDLFWGVVLHKIPVAIALKTILRASGYSKKSTWIYVIIFALMAPVGILVGDPILHSLAIDPSWMLAIAVGMFLHISTTIIFESSEGHKINGLKLLAIITGFVVGIMIQ